MKGLFLYVRNPRRKSLWIQFSPRFSPCLFPDTLKSPPVSPIRGTFSTVNPPRNFGPVHNYPPLHTCFRTYAFKSPMFTPSTPNLRDSVIHLLPKLHSPFSFSVWNFVKLRIHSSHLKGSSVVHCYSGQDPKSCWNIDTTSNAPCGHFHSQPVYTCTSPHLVGSQEPT